MKRYTALFLAAGMLLLTGCSDIGSWIDAALEGYILENSGIQENEDYQTWQSLAAEGKLDENNNYIGTSEQESDTSDTTETGIHVTFAENRYLDIQYYTDEALTQSIQTDACYLNAGDTIYMAEPESGNSYSNLYQLSGFIVYEFDQYGNRSELTRCEPSDSVVFQIPADFDGTELSIVPIGEYSKRALSLSVFSQDDSGVSHSLSSAGSWTVNDEAYESGTASISPIASYILRFDYDEDEYFFVSSEPEAYSTDAEEGTVEFWKAEATDATQDYSVELHRYLTLTLEFSEAGTVSVNGEEPEEVKKGKTWSEDKLKYGDRIVVETSGTCTVTDGDDRHLYISEDSISTGTRITLSLKQECNPNISKEESDAIAVKQTVTVTLDTEDAHGTCTFTQGDEVLSGTVDLREGEKITLVYKLTDDAYQYEDFFRNPLDIITGQQTAEIEITADMDGTVLRREDYINLVKAGD